MLTFRVEQRRGSVEFLYRYLSILSIFTLTVLTTVTAQASQTITVYCGKVDSAVTQVTYKRGVDHPFDLDSSPLRKSQGRGRALAWGAKARTVVDAVTTDIQNGDLNFLNAALDQFNAAKDSQLFTYSAHNLDYSTSGNAPLVITLQDLLNSSSITAPTTTMQVSGIPYVYNGNADPNYEPLCGAVGNYYPLPSLSAMGEDQTAIENWIDYLNSQYPNAIWIGTQEPTHTTGFSTQWDNGGCSNPPASDMGAAKENNISRFISYWTPIAQYLHANNIQSGGIQLNAADAQYYASAAQSMINAGMPLDYFTIQVYRPSATVFQDAYNAYQTFQQSPYYQNVKVIIDRYGIRSAGSTAPPDYASASTLITYLQNEALLMTYADMMYGYNVEQGGLEGNSTDANTNLPQLLTWLQKAPAPLRLVSSSIGGLQGLALVQKTAPQKAYVAVWNDSPKGATFNFSVDLDNLNSSFTQSNLTVQKGTGSTLSTISNSGITIDGDTISGLSLGANEFLLITLQ